MKNTAILITTFLRDDALFVVGEGMPELCSEIYIIAGVLT